MRRILLLALGLGCASSPQTRLDTCLARTRYGTPELRYRAARELARYEEPAAHAALIELLESDDAMTRNAAARSLHERGDARAALHLIRNLHRDMRTFVCTDAIHHLRAMFQTDLGYNPNLGYRHQTEKQQAWWAWWREQGHDDEPDAEPPDGNEAARAALAKEVDAWIRLAAETPDAATARMTELWAAIAKHSKSRHPADVALRERAFGAFAKWLPENPDLWNNHALAALNNGNHATAERSYRRALALVPLQPQLHNDIGILLEGLGRLAEAERAYREALRLAPDDDIAAANLADVIAAQGRTDEALAAYRVAERLAPAKWTYHRLWIGRLSGAPSSPR